MKLEPMRYKDYVWPHNPRTYEIDYARTMALQKVPFGRYYLQNLGMTRRVLRGEGEFAGEGAYDEFRKLASVFYDDKPGILVHPVWQTATAYFVSLKLNMEPLEDYVSYAFEFWETYSQYTGQAKLTEKKELQQSTPAVSGAKTYTVRSGDTMWAIAARNGMTLSALAALNPQISNLNRIYVGDIVYLA